jgi:hypothetical protein
VSLSAAWVVFPLVLLLLCGGLGLLVDLLCGRRLPGPLVAPVGFAAIVVVGEFTTATDATAELTVPLLVALAVAGAGLSLPWRFARPDPVALAVALAVFLVFAAPVLFSGHPTFAGYIKLDDTATWFALTDRAMQHGHSVAGLEPSTYRATLEFNLAGGYPVGTFIPFGTAQKLVGGDLAWVFQPYMAFLASMLSLGLWRILAGLVRRRWLLALAVFIAAQPALLYGYSLWGGAKEVAAAAGIALAAALAPTAVRNGAGWRDTVPLAIACASLAAQLSVGGLVWVAPMLLALAVIAVRRFGRRGALAIAAPFAALLAFLALPAALAGLPPSTPPITDPNAFGNLIGRLNPLQVLGIWPAGDFRVDPSSTVATAILVALGLLATAIGLWVAARRRALALPLYCTVLVGCLAIVAITSPWNGGKALATASPLVLSLAILGAASTLRADRVAGVLLLGAVAGGVLWSNVLAYGGASLAPYGQLVELQHVGERFAGQGPALLTEYNPYGARHFLRDLDAESPSELRNRDIPRADGGTLETGLSADTDELDPAGLFEFRTLVLPRSPLLSRPPLPYHEVWSGDHYEVWQRPEDAAEPPPAFLPLGDRTNLAAVPDCAEVEALAAAAPPGTYLLAAFPAVVYPASQGPFEVPFGGIYEAWLEGSVRSGVTLSVDGRRVGTARHVLSEDRGLVPLGSVDLRPGPHRAKLSFGGPDLHPGSANGGLAPPTTGALFFSPKGGRLAEPMAMPRVEASRLCGHPWDWIEVVER